MRTLWAALGCLLLMMQAIGCDSPALGMKAGDATGPLVILGTAEEPYVRGMVEAFEQETGVQTEYVRKSAGEALEMVRSNRADPKFSVWWGGPVDGYIAASTQGLLEPYKPRGFAMIPRQYKDENGAWAGVYVGALAFAVNTKALAEKGLPEPKGWADLLSPVYRGQITMTRPALTMLWPSATMAIKLPDLLTEPCDRRKRP